MLNGSALVLLFAVGLQQALGDTWTQNPPSSPCPGVFQYQMDIGGIWYALVSVPPPEPNFNIKLKVELGLDAVLPTQYAGKIQLVENKNEAWRRLVTGDKRPLQYRVYFPLTWPLPIVKSIISNNNIICMANPQSTITKLSLDHTLYPIRINGFPEQIEANKRNPSFSGNSKFQYVPNQQTPNVNYQSFPSTQQTQPVIQYQPIAPNQAISQNQPQKQYNPSGSSQSVQQGQPLIQYSSNTQLQPVQQNQPFTQSQSSLSLSKGQSNLQYQLNIPSQSIPQGQLGVQYQTGGKFQPISQDQTMVQYQPGTPSPISNQQGTQYQTRGSLIGFQGQISSQSAIPSKKNVPSHQTVEYQIVPAIEGDERGYPINPDQSKTINVKPQLHMTPPPKTARTTTTTSTTEAPKLSLANECGVSGERAIPLVIKGLSTTRGEWPWLVAMFIKSASLGLQFQCGGSLLSQTIVLTAAHCVKYRRRPQVKEESIVLYMGKFNLQEWTETDSQARDVEEVHLHPDYNSDNEKYDADLAILVLRQPVQFTLYVRPICLWIFSDDINQIVGQTGTVVGWGKDETGSGSSEPHKVSMPIVSQEQCLLSNKEFVFYTSNTTFCAGTKDGSGPCSGDSGGGFMIGYSEDDKVKWYLRGVVHLSLLDRQSQQCDLKSYLIYTDVAKYMDWIRKFVPY